MKLDRISISLSLGTIVLTWYVVLCVQGTQVGWEHFRPFSTVVGILGAFGVGFEKVLWRWAWLHGWLVRRPNLRGTWRVELQSDWVDPDTHVRIPLIVGYMGVTQSLFRLKMHLMTKESESRLIAEEINPTPYGAGYQIAGVYRNSPDTLLRGQRSEIHYGGLILQTHGLQNHPETLDGEYWTDRKTKGRMTLKNRQAKLFTRFEDAKRAFSAA